VGSAPSEVALVVSKVHYRACGDTYLDLKLRINNPQQHEYKYKYYLQKVKMARDVQERA
jgi:hypothetical protein